MFRKTILSHTDHNQTNKEIITKVNKSLLLANFIFSKHTLQEKKTQQQNERQTIDMLI